MENGLYLRSATPEDDPAIAALVVEGFVDKFRPVFRSRLDVASRIMEHWVELEHELGGVRSLIVEDAGGPVASVGIRTGASDDEKLSRRLWEALREHLGLISAVRSAALLSYPRHNPVKTEAYVERLVVSDDHRQQGLARWLLHEAESLGRDSEKHSIGLHVSDNNRPARRLYETEGFDESSRQSSRLTRYSLGIREWIYLTKSL